jgi:hexosaminidase
MQGRKTQQEGWVCVTQATDAGYFALNSQGWYFDNLDATWEQMYVNDPTQGVESAASQARVLGGQGEMWCAKRHFLSTFYIKRSFYQGRLGTNIGKALKKGPPFFLRGETVDASDFEQTIWPRLAAVAEQLWSPQTVTDCAADFTVSGCADCFPLDTAFPRLSAFRCLLNRRGVRAAPLRNAQAREAPPGPDSCLHQR